MWSLVLFNVSDKYSFLPYLETFGASIYYFLQLDISAKILGLGRNATFIVQSQVKDMMQVTIGAVSDFGIMMIIIQAGLFLMVPAITSIYLIIIRVKRVTNIFKKQINYEPWVWLASVNGLLLLGWALSLIHYTPAVELGGRELFAYHISICLFALTKIDDISKLTYKGSK